MYKKIYAYLIFVILSAIGIIVLNIALQSTYANYKVHRKMKRLRPLITALQKDFIAHAKQTGNFPSKFKFVGHNTKLYDITSWIGNNGIDPIAVIQANINGQELGLKAGDGGMITCLLANRKQTVESKCFYQIRKM